MSICEFIISHRFDRICIRHPNDLLNSQELTPPGSVQQSMTGGKGLLEAFPAQECEMRAGNSKPKKRSPGSHLPMCRPVIGSVRGGDAPSDAIMRPIP